MIPEMGDWDRPNVEGSIAAQLAFWTDEMVCHGSTEELGARRQGSRIEKVDEELGLIATSEHRSRAQLRTQSVGLPFSMVTGHQQPDSRVGRPGRESNPVIPLSRSGSDVQSQGATEERSPITGRWLVLWAQSEWVSRRAKGPSGPFCASGMMLLLASPGATHSSGG